MKRIILIIIALVAVVAVTGCSQGSSNKLGRAVAKQDITTINSQVQELRRAEPLPRFHDSAALRVQNAYYTADADPNKTWYVTLVALDGTPYMHLTTKGAPQPAGDQVTNPVQQSCAGGSSGNKNCDVIGLPEPNGVHQGTSTPGYVAILTTGAVVRLPENAVISDQPFDLKSPVKLAINENAQISKTDTATATNGHVPTGTSTRQK